MRLKGLFLIFLASVSTAAGPQYQHKDSLVMQEFRNVYRQLNNVFAMSGSNKCMEYPILCADVDTGRINVGIGPVTGESATATTGGSLSASTSYWYKIYPITVQGKIGLPSSELTVWLDSSQSATLLAWSSTKGASGYRIARGTAQGAQSGYYSVSTTNYTDVGSDFTAAGNAFQALSATSNSTWLNVGGAIITPAGSGGLYFHDYVTGNILGSIATTSSNEIQYVTGNGGASAGVHRFYGPNNRSLISLGLNYNTTQLASYSASTIGPFEVQTTSTVFTNSANSPMFVIDNASVTVHRELNTMSRSHLGVGIDPDSGGLKHVRTVSGSVAAGNYGVVVSSFTTAFVDTNYSVTASITGVYYMRVCGIVKETGRVLTYVYNEGVSPDGGTVNVIAIHD